MVANFKHGVYKGMGSVGFYKNINLVIIDYFMSFSGGIDIYTSQPAVTFSDDIIYLGYKKVQGQQRTQFLEKKSVKEVIFFQMSKTAGGQAPNRI